MPATTASSPSATVGSPKVNPLAVMVFVVFVWGLGPPITKLVTAPPLVGALIRFGISFPILFVITSLRGYRVDAALLRATALPGIAFGLNLVFVFATLQEATVAVLSTTVAIQPVLLLIVAGPIFGERPSVRHVVWSFVDLPSSVDSIGCGLPSSRTSPERSGTSPWAGCTPTSRRRARRSICWRCIWSPWVWRGRSTTKR